MANPYFIACLVGPPLLISLQGAHRTIDFFFLNWMSLKTKFSTVTLTSMKHSILIGESFKSMLKFQMHITVGNRQRGNLYSARVCTRAQVLGICMF